MTRSNADKIIDAVRKHFDVETAPRQRDKWLITCDICGMMWHLKKQDATPGAILTLLNHARGHKPEPE